MSFNDFLGTFLTPFFSLSYSLIIHNLGRAPKGMGQERESTVQPPGYPVVLPTLKLNVHRFKYTQQQRKQFRWKG